jgi:amidophosphoribosyltransferase
MNFVQSTGLREKCGVFGVYGKGIEASRLVHVGLWALQHRGQESSGISSSTGKALFTHKDAGLVAHVYDEDALKRLKGHMAIGHNRYATSGKEHSPHHQPVSSPNGLLALAHNGNLPSTKKLERFLKGKHLHVASMNDSEMMHMAINVYLMEGNTIEDAIIQCFPLFTGVFSLVVLTNQKLVAVRDAYGVRPLSIGAMDDGSFAVSSETCALDAINAPFVRDVEPGEMVVFDEQGMHSYSLAAGQTKLDAFEFIYFARPDSTLLGQSVNSVRQQLGRQLAIEHPIVADVVIPVPDSGIPAAIGFSQQSGIPFDHGFVKNRYIHRTFIRPAQSLRERDVNIKLNVLRSVVEGKRVIIVDDSIVRGTTSKKIVDMVRQAGATEVHMLVSSPPVRYPDYYGINTPKPEDLLASRLSHAEIESYIGANSIGYLSFTGMIAATGLPEEMLNTSCFSGIYPIPLNPKATRLVANIKANLQHLQEMQAASTI